jgi:predicted nuclease with TOPRIM domain
VDDLEERHAALVERDRLIGLEAEADAARAHAARLEAKLAVAQQRLDRKNERIKQLATRVKELEEAATGSGLGTRLSRAVRRG